MAKGRWHLWSTREKGVLMMPEPVQRLPKGAAICGGGDWAELADDKGVERVFVRLGCARVEPARKKVA